MANTKSQKNGFVNDVKFYFLLSRKASQVEYWVVTFFFVFISPSIYLIALKFAEMASFILILNGYGPELTLYIASYSIFTVTLVVSLAFVCWLTAVWRRVLTLGWKISTLVWLIVPVFNLAFVVIIGIMPDRK